MFRKMFIEVQVQKREFVKQFTNDICHKFDYNSTTIKILQTEDNYNHLRIWESCLLNLTIVQ